MAELNEAEELKLEDFGRALRALEEMIARADLEYDVQRDSALMRFAFTSEVAWKFLKVFLLEQQGIDIRGSKDAFRGALQHDLIGEDDATTCLKMIDDRNRLVHEYNVEFADILFPKVRDAYAPALRRLYEGLTEELKR